MLTALVPALMLAAVLQSPPDRSRAEELARGGRTAEAMTLFEQVVALNPADFEARIWVARLAFRLGRTEEAEAGFRAVLHDAPTNIEARIGLATILTRTGDWRAALTLLSEAEQDTRPNADFFSALAGAYRRGGDDRRAFENFERARALAPDDRDIAAGFEAAARSYGHWIAAAGLGQWGESGTDLGSEQIAGDVRVMPRLHLEGTLRVQHGSDYSDTIAGGGAVCRASADTTVTFQMLAGSGNTALPNRDISGDVVHHTRILEISGNVRRLSFDTADITAFSPALAWHPDDRWRTDARYTYSRSMFHETGQSSGDHSVLLRETWQRWPRAAIQISYAYGIESFEDLTADRVGALGATTLSTGLRIDVPSLTRITGAWEHQWRTNGSGIDRLSVALVQFLR